MDTVDYSPEKAGGGGSTASLATMFSPSATHSATKKMADMMHAAPSSLDYRDGSHERLEERFASNWRAMVHGEPHVVAWN